MDPMKRVAAGAVKRNLGPDPSMGQKVELLRRLVAMRQGRKGPVATTGQPTMPGRGFSRPTRLPRRNRMPF